jgi:hypothetical protein
MLGGLEPRGASGILTEPEELANSGAKLGEGRISGVTNHIVLRYISNAHQSTTRRLRGESVIPVAARRLPHERNGHCVRCLTLSARVAGRGLSSLRPPGEGHGKWQLAVATESLAEMFPARSARARPDHSSVQLMSTSVVGHGRSQESLRLLHQAIEP